MWTGNSLDNGRYCKLACRCEAEGNVTCNKSDCGSISNGNARGEKGEYNITQTYFCLHINCHYMQVHLLKRVHNSFRLRTRFQCLKLSVFWQCVKMMEKDTMLDKTGQNKLCTAVDSVELLAHVRRAARLLATKRTAKRQSLLLNTNYEQKVRATLRTMYITVVFN